MLVMKTFVLILVSLFCVGNTNGSRCLQTSLSVKAEFFELSLISSSSHSKLITSSESFRKTFRSLKVSTEISAQCMAFGGSAKSSYDAVTKGSEQLSEDYHEEKDEEVKFFQSTKYVSSASKRQ